MSLSILGSIHHQFYPSLIAQSITYKSKLANHYIYKKIIFLGKKKKKKKKLRTSVKGIDST